MFPGAGASPYGWGSGSGRGVRTGPPVREGDILHFGFQDNGDPPGQNPRDTPPTTDMLAGPPATPEGDPASGCNAAEWTPTFHLGTNDPADTSPKQHGEHLSARLTWSLTR